MSLWEVCRGRLEGELPAQQFNTWIRPLQAEEAPGRLCLLAPNRFVLDWIAEQYLERIRALAQQAAGGQDCAVSIEVGSREATPAPSPAPNAPRAPDTREAQQRRPSSNLNSGFRFDTFVEGKSNQLARAASLQAAENPGAHNYNPLFICGGVGLGKTHLMQAIGHGILQHKPDARVAYLHSERFVADMVRALQQGTINDFKRYYRSLDALLIDDIQFFAGKERTQEEFFHTFNSLFEAHHQIVLTCDRYPKEVDLEERLKSRFGWGLTVVIEPPELETRVAIIKQKAEQNGVTLPDEVAFFIAKRFRSNVRELEGALNRVVANGRLTGHALTLEFVQSALRDLLLLQDKQVTLENIQRTVAEYYQVRVSDLHSKRRNRSIVRPRQIAMALAKELTSHSLPEIGEAFGGRDHTTVLHACRKIAELCREDRKIEEDYRNLSNILTS